jgi:D-proline reductase (dithiol) PrdB
VGLLAREIEAMGVTTVGLALVKEVAVAAHAPRFLYLHWPFGHALGEPGNVRQQRTVLHDMLSMAMSAPRPGLVVDLPYRWRRETYAEVVNWKMPSKAFASALSESNRLIFEK